jgi:hypothetical protein
MIWTKLAIVLFFFVTFVVLVRKRLLNIDLSFPWFLSLVIVAIGSTSPLFIQGTAKLFGIVYAPLVVILLVLFIYLGLITVLGIYITELRRRQILIVRKLAQYDLDKQVNCERNESG